MRVLFERNLGVASADSNSAIFGERFEYEVTERLHGVGAPGLFNETAVFLTRHLGATNAGTTNFPMDV
jgi:hypothetical protein